MNHEHRWVSDGARGFICNVPECAMRAEAAPMYELVQARKAGAKPGDWMAGSAWLTSATHGLIGVDALIIAAMFPCRPLYAALIVGAALVGLSQVKSAAWLANVGHFLAGLAAVLIASQFTGQWWILGVVSAVVAVGIGVKEAFVDPATETGEGLASGAVDWAGWMIGQAVAWGLVVAWR